MDQDTSSAADWTNSLIAGLAFIVACISLYFSWRAHRQSRADGARVEKSTAYMNLELQSSEIFRYESENAKILTPYRSIEPIGPLPPDTDLPPGLSEVRQLYYQTLNLFEVATNFRRQEIVEHEVFASWVSWFYELLEGWHFREEWPEMRGHYTEDVRHIFDDGLTIFEASRAFAEPVRTARRKAMFFAAVGEIMDCEEITSWREKLARELENPVRRRQFLDDSDEAKAGSEPDKE